MRIDAATPAGHPGIAAVVCTSGRPSLGRALASLVDQSVPPLEVLVVDNRPADGRTRALMDGKLPGVRYAAEPTPGLDFARNRALAETTAEIVAFLDDDAIADRDWAAALAAPFADPRVGAVTGRVAPLRLEAEGERLFEANGGFSRGLTQIRLPGDAARPLPLFGAGSQSGSGTEHRAPLIAWAVSVGSGCSLAVRRPLALALGGFDEALDLGAALPGGGDHDMLWRLLGSGHEVVYEPRALAWHEHRQDRAAACRQIAGHQRALIALLVKSLWNARGPERLPIAAFLGWRLVKPAVRLARRLAGRDPLPVAALVQMAWSSWRGLVAYPAARSLARRRRSLVAGR
jgi:glycosyltransferase involved in cell wall biosynthesis